MKNTRLRFSASVAVYFLLFYSLSVHAQHKPLNLCFDKTAQIREESLPLGSGRLGLTPNGGVKDEKIVLNDITLWSGSPQDANNYEANKYLPEIRTLMHQVKTTKPKNWSMKISFVNGLDREGLNGVAFKRCGISA